MPLLPPSSRPVLAAVPRTVWLLGFVSLFMDLSSELIHALLPLFLVSTMGMSVTALGVLEGAAEATAMVVKLVSGPLSDRLGKRRGLLLVGYGLAAVTKPLFPLAAAPGLVIVARIVDRIGKGIRGAPRDALVADVAPPALRGTCYGLRQSMDTIGAIGGPLLAVVLMLALADHIRAVLWFAVVPAFISVALIAFCIREPAHARGPAPFRFPLHWRMLRVLPRAYWLVVGLSAAYMLARFSEAFLVLRARDAGLDLAWAPAVMVTMNVTYALSAYPAGRLADAFGRRIPLVIGLALLIASDLVLGVKASPLFLFVGTALWGLHMGFTQGVFAAMVADVAPARLRGTAFGVFNLASGIALWISSAVAGVLWDRYGAPATFFAGAALGVVPLVLGCVLARRR